MKADLPCKSKQVAVMICEDCAHGPSGEDALIAAGAPERPLERWAVPQKLTA
jgi:hypothetical protein